MSRLADPPRSDEELLSLGLSMAIRLRDGEDRTDVRRELTSLRIADLRELVMCLAACVDPDVPMGQLLEWCGGVVPQGAPPPDYQPRALAPCGTPAAYDRHRMRGEDCLTCRQAMRPLWRARRQKRAEKGRAA